MCNLWSITANQAALLKLFRVINLLFLLSGAAHLRNTEPLGNG
jgi:hypothetical protein